MILSRYPGRYPLFLQAFPGRWRTTVEMTLVTLLAILVGQTFHLPFVDIYPMIIMILWKDNRVMNIALGMVLMGIVLLLCTMLFCGVILSANNNSLKFIIMLIFAYLCFFLTIGSKLSILLGPICGLALSYGLLELSQVPIGEAITEGTLYLLESVWIACGAMILGGLVFGRSPQRVLCQDIAWRLRVSADLLTGQHKKDGSWQESDKLLQGGAVPLLTNVKLASLEKIWASEVLNRMRQASLHAFSCLALSRMAVSEMGWEQIAQSSAARKIAEAMRDMADIFERGDIAVGPDLNLERLDAACHPALDEIAAQLAVFSEMSKSVFPTPPKTGFFLPNALKNPENYRFAAKGTLAVGLCSCLYLALDWSGIHTCVITCFLVGLPTVGEMVSKQVLRIGGTLFGSIYVFFTLIFVLPSCSNIAQFLVVVGIGFLISGWLKNGPEKYSYAGFQISVVLALSEVAKNGLSIDLTTPRDRIIGIIIGLIFTYVIFTRLWPVSSVTRLPPLFRKCFSALERQYECKERVLRLFWASAAQNAIGQAKSFLEAARTEMPPVRLSEKRLKMIEKVLEHSNKLMQTLLLPPTAARTQSAKVQKEVLKRLLEEAELLQIAGKTPATKEFQENPAPT